MANAIEDQFSEFQILEGVIGEQNHHNKVRSTILNKIQENHAFPNTQTKTRTFVIID